MFHLIDVIEVKIVHDYMVLLTFENGTRGEVDISKIVPFKGVFEKLKDKKYFASVQINKDTGTICWDNGADLSPDSLYEAAVLKKAC